MSEEEIRLLRERALSFFGKITASLSHEINNSMAIISQLSGLMEDLLLSAERGQTLDEQKFKDLSQRITNQVKKGQDIIKRLNRFSHSVDDPDTAFDVVEVLERLVSLAQRFAFLKGVSLEHSSEHDSIVLRGNPFGLQQAVFICIQHALNASKKDETVKVTLRADNSAVTISTTCASLPEEIQSNPDLSFLLLLMEELGGKVEVGSNSGEERDVALIFPRASADG
jgi:signal transduction histidine kinase